MAKKSAASASMGAEGKGAVTTVRLDAGTYERLRKMNYETRESMNSIIVRGIELALNAAKY